MWSDDRERWESPDGKYYFDQSAADKHADFFPQFLEHHKGEFAGQPFDLLPYQEWLVVRPLFGWKRSRDGLRRFRKVFVAVPKGNGKALALDTPIPTTGGWSRMGDLRVGDALFDDQGNVCHVIAAHPVQYNNPCYRVTFSDGTSVVADAEHLWQTTSQRNGQPRHRPRKSSPRLGEPRLVTTAEIARTLQPPPTTSLHPQAKWNHRIDVAGPLRTEGAVLPIPPYTLGAWLGDGDSDCARLTMAFSDSGIARNIEADGFEVRQQQRHSATTGRFSLGPGPHGGSQTQRAKSLNATLRKLGLLRNKHIPAPYLRASIEQRLALLQGLMDTDGHMDGKGRHAEFSTKSPTLASGMMELLRSLGYKAMMRVRPATIYGRVVGVRHRIQFTPTPDRSAFRLPRKASRVRPPPATRPLSRSLQVVGCDPVESVPVRCIAVDSSSRLFLAGEGMVPTHNTPLGAGVGLELTFIDQEPGAEVYAAAADRDQAAIMFDTARYMVEANPDLAEMANVLRRAIEVPGTHSYYRVLSADVKSKHGPNIHGLTFDEFHAQPNRDLYETLYRGTVKRRQPVILMITTAGDDDESICAEEWEYARKVISDPSLDETYLPVIFEASKEDDWKDPEVWKRVNPGLGVTVKYDALEAECNAAQIEPRKLNDFLRFHLNRWVNQATAWIPVDWWDACRGEVLDEVLRDLPVYGGLDMAQKFDLAAFPLTFVWPVEEEIRIEVVATDEQFEPVKRSLSLNFGITVVPSFWIPGDTAREHEKTDRVPYSQWAREGLVHLTEGNVIDHTRIFRDILKLRDRFPRLAEAEIGYDPAFATDIALKLQSEGFRMVEVPQNYRNLSEPSHVLEALIRGKRVLHSGHKVLRNHVENVAVRSDDAGRIRPVKPKRASKRIDGVVGTIMALSRAIATPPPLPSVYEVRGVRTF